jgi:hypothetical protein
LDDTGGKAPCIIGLFPMAKLKMEERIARPALAQEKERFFGSMYLHMIVKYLPIRYCAKYISNNRCDLIDATKSLKLPETPLETVESESLVFY